MMRTITVTCLIVLCTAVSVHAQDGPTLSLTVTNAGEPTLSAFMQRHLAGCWSAVLPQESPSYRLDLTVTLAVDEMTLLVRPDIRMRGLGLRDAVSVLAVVDSAFMACQLDELSALADVIQPEGMEFRVRADVISRADAALASEAMMAPASGAAAANPEPPMTGSERDAFRLAVSGCWSVEVGSEASQVTLVVDFELDRGGQVIGNNVELVSATDGSADAIDTAFTAARRAILRCQSSTGYSLPDEKYESWRRVRMTFDPSGMRME